MNNINKLVVVLGLLFTSSAFADFGRCNDFFPQKHAPKVTSAVTNGKVTRELCFSNFAILYSVDSKTPVYAVERLSYLTIGRKEPRTNHFHEEPMLRPSERSTLADYKGSGYDRGHNAPAGDMNLPLSMEESFSMVNLAPQSSHMNRGPWAKSVEIPTRKYVARSAGDVFVFTGGYFIPNQQRKTIGANHVWVPDYFYKLVYDSQTKRAWAYFMANTDEARASRPITYQELSQKIGMQLLDGLEVKN